MAIFFIEPFEKVGIISFNESRESVRSKMGDYKEFRKTRFSKNTTDDFGGCCHVFYTENDTVKAVELFRDAIPVYKHKNFFLLSPEQIKKMMNDPNMKEDELGIDFPSYGIGISISDGMIESVCVNSKEY